MSITFYPASFKADGTNQFGREVGTAEFEIRGTRYTTRAIRRQSFRDDSKMEISYDGFVGRYRTSNKPWGASVCVVDEGVPTDKAFVHFGRDDRSGNFSKLAGLSFEPSDKPNPSFHPAA